MKLVRLLPVISVVSVVLVFSAFAEEKKAGIEPKRLYTASAQASSFLLNNWNKYQENYHPNYAFDDNVDTAWVEGAAGNGIGESLTWKVSTLESASKVILNIKNGYQKSDRLFAANAAPRKIQVSLLRDAGKPVVSKSYELKKSKGIQRIELDIPKEEGFSLVELKIVSTHPGTVYKDTCVSDIETWVVSKVPYNEKAELAKQNELKNWIKSRLEDAKYFAKLPVQYPFASSAFRATENKEKSEQAQECTEERMIHPEKYSPAPFSVQFQRKKPTPVFKAVFTAQDLAFMEEAFVKTKALRADPAWYRKTLSSQAKALKAPDISGLSSHLSEDVVALMAQHLHADQITFFEANQAVASSTSKGNAYSEARQVVSNDKIARDSSNPSPKALYFWVKTVGVERGVWERQQHFLLAYGGDKRLEKMAVWEHSDDVPFEGNAQLNDLASQPPREEDIYRPGNFLIFNLDYAKDGKVKSFTVKSASYDSVDCGVNVYTKTRLEGAKTEVAKNE